MDLTLAAGAAGWTATLARPNGFTLVSARASWEDDGVGRCTADIVFKRDDIQIDYSLSRWDETTDHASARIDMKPGGKPCMGNGIQVTATFTPDAGGLPPIAAELLAVAGRYEVAAPWPAIECPVQPAKQQRFEVAIDRTKGDALVVTGLPWTVDEARYNGKANVYVRSSTTFDADDEKQSAELLLLLDVAGDAVTGRAKFSAPALSIDDPAPCKTAEVKVTGTRTPGPAK